MSWPEKLTAALFMFGVSLEQVCCTESGSPELEEYLGNLPREWAEQLCLEILECRDRDENNS